MTDKFHAELRELKRDVLEMGYFGRNMLSESMKALENRDPDLADRVISRKLALAEKEDVIEEHAYQAIALYQPMASDLRTIICSLKIITSSERIGRYGKGIASIVSEFADRPHIHHLASLPQMADLVLSMIDDALTAYEQSDISLIREHSHRDDRVDALRYSILRACLSYMMEDPKNITLCIYYVQIARYLERCADHACEMAEKVHYMVTGERIVIK